MVVDVSPAGVLAATVMSCSSPLSQDTCRVTAPWSPAADPAMVLITCSELAWKKSAVAAVEVDTSASWARMSRCASLTPAVLPSYR